MRGCGAALALLLWAQAAAGVDPRTALVSNALDNSFLIQEAYNQEAGVVQSIASVELAADSGERAWEVDLSQESAAASRATTSSRSCCL